ncbi:putative uncharacterized protein DDB_G0271982 [Temnothorax curvispinosus]|uniref:Protein MNN4-like n=1 Tax=Temnothorax curvispinosus TaxID=300111 RepID=A0A6J1RBL8_9HYME|nr:putative uncharacterized protein DDB_G0271982 [Temnothorax curvispinosus]
MEAEKEIGLESEQQGNKGKRRESEREKKTRSRPTKAEELAKQRERSDSLGSVKEFIQKRKRKELEEEAARAAEIEILEKFNKERRVDRSPPTKIKKEERGEGSMATEDLLKEILKKMNRSPPAKIKKDGEGKESITAEEMLKEILKKIEEQEKEKKR